MRTRATGAHKIHSTFSVSGGVLSFYRDNASTQIAFGESDEGLDVKFYGDTASAWVLWDESADTLYGASSATLEWYGTAAFSGGEFTVESASMKLGNASTDKIGFFGATPVVQIANVATTTVASTIAIGLVEQLISIGLMASA